MVAGLAIGLGLLVFLAGGFLDLEVYELYLVVQTVSVKRTPFDLTLTAFSGLGLLTSIAGLVVLWRQMRRP